MIALDKGSAAATQATPPAAGGFFQQMKSDFQALGDKIQAPYNAMTEEQKKRYQKFNELAQYQPTQPQFSPVQFGGGANGASLLAIVEEMKKRGF